MRTTAVHLSVGVLSLLAPFSSAQALKHPEGPSQQCTDDAGPPWNDDEGAPYFAGFAAKPKLLASGACPTPLDGACKTKGALAAFHDGPVNCGGAGWFCIITEQDGHRNPGVPKGKFPDGNFAFCERKGVDPGHDVSGHCHGSDKDDTYGWWVRDHWHRNYAGKLKCCCNWEAAAGVVNRCDYRKAVTPKLLQSCRDANEEHTVDFAPNCANSLRGGGVNWPPARQCWEMEGFGPAGLGDDGGDGGDLTQEPTEEGGGDDDEEEDGDDGEEEDGDDVEEDFPRSTAGTTVSDKFGKVYIVGSSELDGEGSTNGAVETSLASALGTLVVNNAVGGATLKEIKALPACSSDKSCKWSILSGGINGDRKKAPKRMRGLIRRELAAGKKVVVIGYLKDCGGYASGKEFNHFLAVYKRFSKKTKNVWFVDSKKFPGHPLMGKPCDPASRRYRAGDNSHPSAFTGKLWGERIAEIIKNNQ